MKRNEKILASGLGLVVAGYFGWPIAKSIYITPVEDRQVQVDVLAQEIRGKELKQHEVQLAAKRLVDWKSEGLPGDALDAQRLYQQWVTELAVASGIAPKVAPTRTDRMAGIYNTVLITLEGQTTFKKLQTFLRRFHSAELLHRVVRLDLDSPAAEGDPSLKYTLLVEGVNLLDAPKRDHVFPQVELKEPLAAATAELTLPAKEFAAKPGDMVRIGAEFAEIAAIDGDTFHLTRAADGTSAVDHAAGTVVELFPVRRDPKSREPLALAAAIDSPFVKPRKYDPRFDGFSDQKIARGGTAKMTVKVADFDATAGATQIQVSAAPEGMNFDAATGELVWAVPSDLPNGDYKITLAADIPAPAKRIEKTVTITVGDPNAPPTLDPVTVADVFLGERVRVPLKATDAGPVTYKLEQGPPGAAVDPSSGVFTWTVAETTKPGETEVAVSASDTADPPLSTRQTFKIYVREDLRPFVKLTGYVQEERESGSLEKAFLRDLTSNQTLTLYEGKPFKAAGIAGVVREITPRYVTFERDGELWKLASGRSLADLEKMEGGPVAEAKEKASEAG